MRKANNLFCLATGYYGYGFIKWSMTSDDYLKAEHSMEADDYLFEVDSSISYRMACTLANETAHAKFDDLEKISSWKAKQRMK